MIWGLAAGAAGGAGAMLLFRGLGKGSMSVVAPVTATGAALVPVAVGLAQGDSLGPFGLVGVVLALQSKDVPPEYNEGKGIGYAI